MLLEKHVLWLAHLLRANVHAVSRQMQVNWQLFEDRIMSQQHLGKNNAHLLVKTELLLASDAAKHIHKAN